MMSCFPDKTTLCDASPEIYQRIFSQVADGIVGVDEGGVIRLCNPAAEKMFGWPPGQLLGRSLDVLLPDQIRGRHAQHLRDFANGEVEARYMNQRATEIRGQKADGSEISLWATILRTQSESGHMMVAVLRDVTDTLRHQRELQRLADLDPLTGLPNRRAFYSMAEKTLEHCHRLNEPVSLAIFDLDHFKLINDTYGHLAGDRVLECFGNILSRSTRPHDFVARWGGEEFILLLSQTDLELSRAAAERIRREVQDLAFSVGPPDHLISIHATVSVGITASSDPSDSLRDLIQRADTALYEAKRRGRNRVNAVNEPINVRPASNARQVC